MLTRGALRSCFCHGRTGITLGLMILSACTSLGTPAASDPGRKGPPSVVLAPGEISRQDQDRAARLTATARAALGEGRVDDALAAASEVVDRYPAAPTSGEALSLMAQALERAARWEEAAAAAARLGALLPAGDPRAPEVAWVQARALSALGRPVPAVARLLALPAPPAALRDDLLQWIRATIEPLDREQLGQLLQETALGQPLAAPVMVSYGRASLLAGDRDAARLYGQAALDAGARGVDAEMARVLLEGRLPGGSGLAGHVGLLLPLSGSPALRRLADQIRQGAEAAVAAAGLDEAVALEVLDEGGDPRTAAALVRTGEERGVVAVVGPLQSDVTAAASAARRSGIAIVSPTTYEVPDGAPAVYSLASMDPGAPRALAEWASAVGIRQAVVIHASRGVSFEEATAFREAFESRGGSVLRMLAYEPGATFFREQIQVVVALHPEALVLPVPPEDVQALASQVTFFGLDTLGVQVLGTAGWADEGVLQEVNARHLNGVVAAVPSGLGAEAPGYRRFADAYERHFQRTLLAPALPALGYDATSLILLALGSGARTPTAIARALEGIRGFEGATGILSVREGRIVREHRIVCLWSGTVRPLPAGLRPEPLYRPYPADPETGEVPPGPGRQYGFGCPDGTSPDGSR